jgi:hypothetical protein
MKSFANVLQNARKVRAPAQSQTTINLEQAQRAITQAEETQESPLITTPSQKLSDRLISTPPLDQEGVIQPEKAAQGQMEQQEALVQSSSSSDPMVRAQAARGTTDIEGNTSFDTEPARVVVEAEKKTQYEQAPTYTKDEDFFNYGSADQLKNKFSAATSTRDTLLNVIATSKLMRPVLDDSFRLALDDTSMPAQNMKSVLVKNGLLDETTNQLQPKVVNALTIQLLEVINDDINKRDERLTGKYNSTQSDNIFVNQLNDDLEPNKIVGQTLNTDYIRGTLARGIIDKLVANPKQVGSNISTGYGGASTEIDAEAADYLDKLLWNTVKEAGFLQEIVDGSEGMYRMSKEADHFFSNAKGILDDIQAEKRIDVSSTATVEGESLPGLSRLKGKKAGPVSLKSKMDQNTRIENRVKNNLGRMPLRIMEERFNFAMQVVASIIEVDENGTIVSLKGQSDKGWYSTEPWASMIGLDETKWQKAYAKGLKTHQGDDALAVEQADRVMRRETKKIYQTIIDGDQRRNRVFYNKWFHASSVGRYFVRNTILNYQDSKLVRNFVGNAKRVVLNLNSKTDTGSKVLKNWRYIIGKNLLSTKETGGVKTEDMGWDAVQKISDKIISDPSNPVYQNWYNIGTKLRKMPSEDFTTTEKLTEIVGTDFLDKFQDNAEWGYAFQSLVDFAKFVDAKKEAKANPDSIISFEPAAQTQHDGKQNGIAIQALQFGDEDMLALIGGIYDNEDNIIPQGDIRKRFMDTMPSKIGNQFIGNPDKDALWQDILLKINESADRKAITKMLSKTPLMEVSYGKSPQYNEETVISFLDSKYGSIVTDSIATSDVSNYERREIINDLNKLIEATLHESINIRQQKATQALGLVWSMLGQTPSYKGPLGTNIFLGSTEFQGTGRSVPIPTPQGVIQQELMVSKATGSARSKRKMGLNKETSMWERQEPSRFGQEVSNQLPVISVQQIDGAIMAKTINDINKGRKEALFMLPVHDAIITDASSVDQYHARINKNFVKVNSDYNLAKNIRMGFDLGEQKFLSSIDDKQTYLVSEESKYRAMHTYLLSELKKEEEKKGKLTKPLNNRYVIETVGTRAKMLARAKLLGWESEGANLSGAKLKELYFTISGYLNVKGRTDNWMYISNTLKPDALRALAKRIYQYN